jgi:hypothetical protein
MLEMIEEYGGWVNTFLMKNEQGELNFGAVLLLFGVPLLLLLTLCFLIKASLADGH